MVQSKHFNSTETACPCCGFNDIRAELLCALEELRELVDGPVFMHSGCRCVSHNKNVGGGKKSRHLDGMAADILAPGYTPEELAALAEEIPRFRDGGIGIYKTHIHVDIAERTARWTG